MPKTSFRGGFSVGMACTGVHLKTLLQHECALACVWTKRKMYFVLYSHECTHGVAGLARPWLLRSGDPPKLLDDLLLGYVTNQPTNEPASQPASEASRGTMPVLSLTS
jgi:hypothetical protein